MDDYGKDKYKYTAGDNVWLCPSGTRNREGPYMIQDAEGGKYSLCDDNGQPVKVGQTFGEEDLILHDPFEG